MLHLLMYVCPEASHLSLLKADDICCSGSSRVLHLRSPLHEACSCAGHVPCLKLLLPVNSKGAPAMP